MDFAKAYSTLDNLYEAKRVVHDVDVLYHYTNPLPFFKIFTEGTLRGDINTKAVCLTTDREYIIYDYPCGIQFSRNKLLADGYELVPFDEFDDDPYGDGESEERIYGNIEDVSKYVTAVYINWRGRDEAEISVVQSPDGDRIGDSKYDDMGEMLDETYELKVSDFRSLLDQLKAKGIKVVEKGSPMYGEYYLDYDGKLHYGEMPSVAIAV